MMNKVGNIWGHGNDARVYKLTIMLASALALVGVVLFISYHKSIQEMMGVEIFKLSYQFLLLVVIGGTISWLFSQYTREQEEKEARRELQRSFQANLIEAYNSTKRIRRLLRAEARHIYNTNNEIGVKHKPYCRLMRDLIDVQLKFEFLKKEVEITDLFIGISELRGLNSQLSSAEKYLHDIIEEYEESYNSFSGNDICPLKKLPRVAEFIYSPIQHNQLKISDDFRDEFKVPSDEAMIQLLKILIDYNIV